MGFTRHVDQNQSVSSCSGIRSFSASGLTSATFPLKRSHEGVFFLLLLLLRVQAKAEASWDSTVHECPQLSRVTAADQRVYLTVKAVLGLSHPAHLQLVLRKRICVSVTGRQVSGSV